VAEATRGRTHQRRLARHDVRPAPAGGFSRTTGPVAAATIEYVVHLATGEPSIAPGEYVYLSCCSPLSSEGFAVQDATMWAPEGRVLAAARQTRLAGA
jgi:acyl-CoA thioesterase